MNTEVANETPKITETVIMSGFNHCCNLRGRNVTDVSDIFKRAEKHDPRTFVRTLKVAGVLKNNY